MGYLGATLTQVFTRVGGADVSLRDITIAQIENKATECGWRHAPEAHGGFWRFWKSQFVELSPTSGEDGWLSLARGGLVAGATRFVGEGRWKSQNRKNVYLSPYVEEPINSKVIKSFVPELRSRKFFSCFEIPMFYVYILRTFYVRFTHGRIWLWYTPNQAETLLHSMEQAATGIGLYVNAHKTEYMCFNQTVNISTIDGSSLKLVDKFTYLGSSVSSTEKDINARLKKEWIAIDKLSIIWKSDLTDKMKRSFFQAAIVSILLYGYTTWTLTKRPEKKLDGNYTRMLRAILNKSWRQHPTKHQLYGHLPSITKTIQARRTRNAGHCWRSREELIRDILLWTPTYGRAKTGRPARTYIQQLCEDTGCSSEDLTEAMNDKGKWWERVWDIRASGTTWRWWWYI